MKKYDYKSSNVNTYNKRVDIMREFIKIIPNCNIKYDEDDGCWYCWVDKYS